MINIKTKKRIELPCIMVGAGERLVIVSHVEDRKAHGVWLESNTANQVTSELGYLNNFTPYHGEITISNVTES